MRLSTDRFLTTHVGSLPRGEEVSAMLLAKDKGELQDQATFDACMAQVTKDVVARQVEAGIDVVSDGETSKVGYATYIKDRLTGFEGSSPRRVPADLTMYPRYMKKIATPAKRRASCGHAAPGRSRSRTANRLKRTSPT